MSHETNPLWVRQYLEGPFIGPGRFPAFFFDKVQRPFAEGDCWIWVGRIDKRHGTPKHPHGVPRVLAYEALLGNIPERSVLFATCSKKLCINPDHQEVRARGHHLWGDRPA